MLHNLGHHIGVQEVGSIHIQGNGAQIGLLVKADFFKSDSSFFPEHICGVADPQMLQRVFIVQQDVPEYCRGQLRCAVDVSDTNTG